MGTTAEDERAAAEKAAGLDNLRKMFRLTMATNYRRAGESLEACKLRVAADPATASVAAKLHCTVEQLLTGWGGDEQLHTQPGYNHRKATDEVEAIILGAAHRAHARDSERAADKRDTAVKHAGVLAAPMEGERLGAVVETDAASAAQFKEAMRAVRNRGSGSATGLMRKPGDDAKRPAGKTAAPVKGKPGSKPQHAGKSPARPSVKGRAHKD